MYIAALVCAVLGAAASTLGTAGQLDEARAKVPGGPASPNAFGTLLWGAKRALVLLGQSFRRKSQRKAQKISADRDAGSLFLRFLGTLFALIAISLTAVQELR